MPKSNYFIFGIFMILMMSCGQNNFYFEETSQINNQWEKTDVRTFSIPVKDTTNEYSLFFILRNNSNYEFSNIYFFTTLISPQGEQVKDTLEYQLAYPDGEWIGFGMGDVKQNTLVFKENIALKDSGIYKVQIQQAMRKEILIGIEDISLLVEKTP